MKSTRESPQRQLVLVGGGHSHVEVLRRLAMRPAPHLGVTLISRGAATPYSGMLPGYIAGHYACDDCHIDLHRLCRAAKARFLSDEATGLDLARRQVVCRARPPVPYDVLSLDIGSTPDQSRVPGAGAYTLPVKPVERFIPGWRQVEDRIIAERRDFRIVVVGGGAGGTELCLALHYRIRQRLSAAGDDPARVAFGLVSETAELLPTHYRRVRSTLTHALRSRGIDVHLGRFVERVTHDHLHFATGEPVRFDAAIWVTSAAPAAWLRSTGLALDQLGFVRVDASLRSVSHADVFAAGDVAALDGLRLEKSGVYAVRQGPILAHNLMAHGQGSGLKRYRPQRKTLALISTGERYAMASKWRLTARGRWVWSLKDRIDRRWMRKYQRLGAMPGSGMAGRAGASMPPMHCGGCGAKVGSELLHRVLAELDVPRKPGIVVGLNEPDDAAVLAPPPGFMLAQSVDYFRPFIDDPYRFARIATNHCLGDLYAMGAAPHSALAVITLPHGGEEAAESDLRHLMLGAIDALTAAGATLIGGHTGRGEELGFGLTVNGLARRGQLMRKGGLRPGDALILTKPLGTGVLFAGHMRGLARAAWIEAALAMMDQSSLAAIEVLRRFGVVACTDVTGFGLVGHLLEMLRASGTDAIVQPRAIPALAGAIESLAEGVESSLAPQNRALGAAVENKSTASPAEVGLLYDPQTAGGLLAGVGADRAQECIDALVGAGFASAQRIGTVTARASGNEAIVLVD